ncbi:MAG: hypothetical protein AMK72_01940 [Planctomycetes bacterium SM23_25]|nr:MAG: hypothetical protein AMK72_01940 [Planctomycetes bacterium SM23_25]
MAGDCWDTERTGRRQFLSRLSAAAAASGLAWAGQSAAHGQSDAPIAPLPTIALGKHQVTRLVAGWNPIGGHSYLGHHTDRHMKEYFTVERTVEFLLRCEREGINAHQFSSADKTVEVLRRARERGSKMHFIGLHSGRSGIREMIEGTQPIGMVHHGGVTDRLFAQGKSRDVHDYVKEAHDRGVLAGVSAHNPDCIKQIADEDWEVDLFMACFYFLTRKKTAPLTTLHLGYPFYAADPQAMTAVMRQVKQPCLGFKILAAGRRCANQNMVRDAFRFAFQNIKPTDGVVVGMYPQFFDEIRANAQYAREFGRTE